MPIPSAISDLSKVASENSPAGTESVKGTIDDYLRAGFSFDRQLFDLVSGPTVMLPSATTVNVGFAGSINIGITGTTSIFAFDSTAEGALRWVIFFGALTLVHNASTFQMPGGANIVTVAGDAALFKSLGGGAWACVAYMRKSGSGPVAASSTKDGYLSATDWSSFNSRMTAANVAAAYMPLSGGGTIIDEYKSKLMGALGTQRVAWTVTQGDNIIRYRWGLDSDESPVLFTYNNTGVYNGSVQFPAGGVKATGAITAPTVTETSDARLKKSWRRLPPDLLENVTNLKKVGRFLWRKDGTPGLGGSAQELEQFLPWAVHTDDKGFKSVRYGAAAFVIVVELARAFFSHVAKTEKRLAKLEAK